MHWQRGREWWTNDAIFCTVWIQDPQMMDGLRQHVCDTSPSLLLLSPPRESPTLNPRAQHVMMGRALPNSACRGPTAAMEELERVGQGQEAVSLTSSLQLLVCFPLCFWPGWINRATSTQYHASCMHTPQMTCTSMEWKSSALSGNLIYLVDVPNDSVPTQSLVWFNSEWTGLSPTGLKGLCCQELHRVQHLCMGTCNAWLLFVLSSNKADGSSRTAASWNSSGASSHV